MSIIKIEVAGEKLEINESDLNIKSLGIDMDKVAAQMGRFGVLWAAAEEERMTVDASYRFWKAKTGQAILAREPKLAEWKVRQKIESSKEFRAYKRALAEATRNTIVLRSRFDAFRTKAGILQSQGAMRRAELESTGMSTKATERRERKTDEIVDQVRKDAEGIRKKLKKGKRRR